VTGPVVYLLHLDQKLGSAHPLGGAQHYLGQTQDLTRRVETHRAGVGAKILAAAVDRGISFEVVRTWPAGRDEERQLKRQHNAPKLCPRCS
jgi:predicted GIY-YIG superfamily endonuclease